jgi:hypothetical protein
LNWDEPGIVEKMKTRTLITRTWETAAVLSAALALLLAAQASAQNIRYAAQPAGSNMKMDGTSTVHPWTVTSPVIGGFIEADVNFPSSALTDPKAAKPVVQAFIPVITLKSYMKRMDEVMQEALHMAKYPKLESRLIELKPKSAPGSSGSLQFDAVGALIVSGTTLTNTMPVTIEKVGQTQLKIVGSIPLKMTDFGVVPPAPKILGMSIIKTGDEIKISFEWMTVQKAEPAKTP